MLSSTPVVGTRKKKYMREFNNRKIEEFKKSDSLAMTIVPVSYLPGVKEGFINVKYTKEIKKIGKGKIFIIKKDGVPVSFTWEVQKKDFANINKAVAEGIYHPGALTAEVLCAMGTYHSTVLVDRVYENGIISNKYAEKNELLAFSQKRVELLQRLELLINSNSDVDKVKSELNEYLREMRDYKAAINSACQNLKKYDADIKTKFENYLEEDIKTIEKLHDSLNDTSIITLLRAYGNDSMQVRLQMMMINITKQAQGINRNLTYATPESFLPQALFNGDFNSMCENVMHVIDRYEPDLHNQVLPEHQGDFTKKQHDKLYLEFSVENKKALAAICKIENGDSIEQNDGKFIFKNTNSNESIALKTTRLTNWASIWSSFEKEGHFSTRVVNFFKRVAFFACNVFTGTLLTPVDIVMGIAGGLFGFELSLVEIFKRYPQKDLPKSDYLTLSEAMKVPNRPIAFYLALLVGQTTKSIVIDIVRGMALTASRISRIPKLVVYDYYVGGWGDKQQTTDQILEELDTGIKTIEADKHASEIKSPNPDEEEEKNKEERHFALPPYYLSSGEWRDAGSMIPKGLIGFGNTILNTHTKDPVLGFIYNVFYFSGLSAIFIPDQVRLPDFYKEFSGMIGTHMAHGVVGQGISNAVTQAQMSVLLFEVFHRGPNSLLGQLVNKLEKNLVDVVVFLILARMTGGAIRKLPVIGTVIDEELGTSESVGLITYASKLAILFYEICEEGEIKEISEEKKKQFIERFTTIQKKYEENKNVPTSAEQTLNTDFIEQLKPFRFLMKLAVNSTLLPELPTLTKRKLLQEAQHLFPDKPEVRDAVENMLYPDYPYSIASRTLHIVTGYVINAGRILMSPMTGNFKQPFRDLTRNISKDLARVVRIIYSVFEVVGLMLYAGVYTFFRATSDALFNGVFARLEGLVRGNKHALSKINIKAASSISTTYYGLCARLSTPANKIYKAVTYRDPGVVIAEQEKCFPPLFTGHHTSTKSAPASAPDSPTNKMQ